MFSDFKTSISSDVQAYNSMLSTEVTKPNLEVLINIARRQQKYLYHERKHTWVLLLCKLYLVLRPQMCRETLGVEKRGRNVDGV